jgi:hypothetical protein
VALTLMRGERRGKGGCGAAASALLKQRRGEAREGG